MSILLYMTDPKPKKKNRTKQLEKLGPRHHRAIDLMIRGFNNEQVAQKIGCSFRVVQRWRYMDYRFKAELERRSAHAQEVIDADLVEWLSDVEGRGRKIVPKALERLETILDDDKVNASAHVAAARTVLERFAPIARTEEGGVETEDFAALLEAFTNGA